MVSTTSQRGFTLIEMLVAVFIVAISVTIFFQLLSSSMKLAFKSRDKVAITIRANELFSTMLTRDLLADDFVWQGDMDGAGWQLQLQPLQVRDDTIMAMPDSWSVKLPAEVYNLLFTMKAPDSDRTLATFSCARQYPPGYFSDQFKQQHMITAETNTGETNSE